MTTKAEKKWLGDICQIGCIVCRLHLGVSSPAEPHHMLLKSGRRMGHLFTLPLCPAHHRGHRNDEICVSRHPYRTAFEKRYGTEAALLERTRELVSGASRLAA